MQWILNHLRPTTQPPLQPDVDWLEEETRKLEELHRRYKIAVAVETRSVHDEREADPDALVR